MENDLRRWMICEADTNLRAWFGDSKIVDAKGDPLMVYHGTTKKFTTFDLSKIKSGVGFWFSSDPAAAAEHTHSIDRRGRTLRGRVIKAYLRIENPATSFAEYDAGQDADGRPFDGYVRASHGLYVAYRPDQIRVVDES
jgi:hypothetical protein